MMGPVTAKPTSELERRVHWGVLAGLALALALLSRLA